MNKMEEFETLIKSKLENRKVVRIEQPGFRPSAVLMPFFYEDDQLKVLFTVRHKDLKHHKGEISFPGGKKDDEDKDLIETALRETKEEVGIDRSQITIVGQMDDLFTLTKYIITPYVGIITGNFKIITSDQEVFRVIKVPLSIFGKNGYFQEEEWKMTQNGASHPIFYYYWRKNIIWGATAYMMNQFMEIIYDYQPSKFDKIKRTDTTMIKEFLGLK